MLAAFHLLEFYRFKKKTDLRYAISTLVQGLYEDNLDDYEYDHESVIDQLQSVVRTRGRRGQALNKYRFIRDQLQLAIERLATERELLLLERHLLAVAEERERARKERRFSARALHGILQAKLQGRPSDPSIYEALDDVDNNNNEMSLSSSSDMNPSREFHSNVLLEDRLHQHFPKLLNRSRSLSSLEDARDLQQDIKLQQATLDCLYLKVESMVYSRSFPKPTNPSSTSRAPRASSRKSSEEKSRKRKQTPFTALTSKPTSKNSRDCGRHPTATSVDNIFRDVIFQTPTSLESRPLSRTASTTDEFHYVTIEIVDATRNV
ncbi:uncharacterized protein [Diadema setosum]|uniref:uncharacterized protein n=1 Tax=Diadema setosum TaxID=31175 RepID=UPI003B3A3D79